MTFKSPETSSVNVIINTQSVLDIIDHQEALKEKQRGYIHVATGVLQRLNIQQNDRDLSTVLGDCTNRTNLHTVTEWIFDNDSNLQFFGREEIEYYARMLWDVLSDFFDL